MKMQNAQLYLKGATVIYGSQQDYRNQRQSWKDYTALTGSIPSRGENVRASFQLVTRWMSVVFVEVHFTEMSEDRYLFSERA